MKLLLKQRISGTYKNDRVAFAKAVSEIHEKASFDLNKPTDMNLMGDSIKEDVLEELYLDREQMAGEI
jgi:hypothetical protein